MGSVKNSQLAVIKSGLLSKLGTTKSKPLLEGSALILNSFGQYVVNGLKENLNKDGIRETSSLYQSISFTVNTEGSFIILNVLANDYYIFLDKGVKGKKEGRSDANYSFKVKKPPLSAFAGASGWLARKPISQMTFKDGTVLKINSKTNTSAAFIVQRAVFNKGIKPTGFYSDLITDELFNVLQDAILEQNVQAFITELD